MTKTVMLESGRLVSGGLHAGRMEGILAEDHYRGMKKGRNIITSFVTSISAGVDYARVQTLNTCYIIPNNKFEG